MLMTQTEFAEMLVVCFSAVNRLETGKHSPTMKTKRKLAAFFEKYEIEMKEQ